MKYPELIFVSYAGVLSLSMLRFMDKLLNEFPVSAN